MGKENANNLIILNFLDKGEQRATFYFDVSNVVISQYASCSSLTDYIGIFIFSCSNNFSGPFSSQTNQVWLRFYKSSASHILYPSLPQSLLLLRNAQFRYIYTPQLFSQPMILSAQQICPGLEV